MGMKVEVTIPPAGVQFAAQVRAAMVQAAEETVLPAAVAGAPWEPEPKHDVHLRDTAFVRLEAAQVGGDAVRVGFRAYWAAWQHEKPYKHTHGHRKYLELAMAEQGRAWLTAVAERLRKNFRA